MKSISSVSMLTLVLISTLAVAFNIRSVKASGTIYIRADGSIDPLTAPIQRNGDLYVITSNITSDGNGIVIERDNITLDGAGYTLQGPGASPPPWPASSGVYLDGRHNATIRNLKITMFPYGIHSVGCLDVSISENTVAGNGQGIYLNLASSFSTISNNDISGNLYFAMSLEHSSSHNLVSGNLIHENGLNGFGGIRLTTSSDNNVISGNNVTNTHQDGIDVFSSNNSTIVGNNLIANWWDGIHLSPSSNSTVSGNNIMANGWRGIELYQSTNNRIVDNTITENGDWGIWFSASSGNDITRNNITANNPGGVILRSSSDNEFYHNNFTNNVQQVYNDNSSSIWDDGYPSGGNYWSDYAGVDLCSGPYQNETGSDGIGDTPYIIDEGNSDNYPLIPWGTEYVDYDWPMLHHDLGRTGFSPSIGPSTNTTLWQRGIGRVQIGMSPAVSCDMVYLGSYDPDQLYCLNASTGESIWNYTTGGNVDFSPAIAEGRVYVGSNDGKIYCLNASNGDFLWSYNVGGVENSPAITNGRIYVGSAYPANTLFCLNASNGGFIWSYNIGIQVESSPAVVGGMVYLGASYKVLCLNASNGGFIWAFTTGGCVDASVAVSHGAVYAAAWAPDYKVYCLDASDGEQIWNYTLTGYPSAPSVAYGKVYIGTFDDDLIYCLNASTGVQIWNHTLGGDVDSSSPAVADGKLYIGTKENDQTVYCLNASTGTQIWDFRASSHVRCSPAVANGNVYAVSSDGTVYAFGPAHDIAIASITTSKTGCSPTPTIGQGYSLPMNITVANQGSYAETFNVTVYANTTIVETREITLSGGSRTTLTLLLNTASWTKGKYALGASATPVQNEMDTIDNTLTGDSVIVTIPGDIEGDRDVDIFDIVRMAMVYGVSKPNPRYDPNSDIDGDGDVDIFDIVIAAGNYGESW